MTTTTDQEDVSHLFEKYGFRAIPVVDAENRLVGIVTIDDAISIRQDEASEDIAKTKMCIRDRGLSVQLRPVSLVGNEPIVRKSVLDVYMNKRYDTIKTAEKSLRTMQDKPAQGVLF